MTPIRAIIVGPHRAERMRRIFHDLHVLRARNLGNRRHVAALPGKMDRENRIRAPVRRAGNRGFEILCAHQAALRIDVGKDDLGPCKMRSACGRNKSDRRHDNRVVRPDPECA